MARDYEQLYSIYTNKKILNDLYLPDTDNFRSASAMRDAPIFTFANTAVRDVYTIIFLKKSIKNNFSIFQRSQRSFI